MTPVDQPLSGQPRKGSVVVIGPAYPLRGGLATFDQRLAREFIQQGFDCRIYSFSLQYPDFLFPGTTQYSTDPPPEGLTILSRINSINPLNWWSVGRELRRLKPDLIVVRYWLPLMGPALGTILRRVRKSDGRPNQRGASGPTERRAYGPAGTR